MNIQLRMDKENPGMSEAILYKNVTQKEISQPMISSCTIKSNNHKKYICP